MTELQQTVLDGIIALGLDTTLDETFYEMVILRLESLGYAVAETDIWPLGYAIKSGENHFINFCHFSKIPDGLLNNLCDVVCAEFLKSKYALGDLDDETIQGTVQSISMGDTTVNFGSDDFDFVSLLDELIQSKAGDLICYRSIKW